MISLWFHIDFMLIRRESLVHEGKGKAYDKREKGKAGGVKGKRERHKTGNLIRDPTRHPDRAHARTTRNDFPVRGGLPKGELTPPNLRYIYIYIYVCICICICIYTYIYICMYRHKSHLQMALSGMSCVHVGFFSSTKAGGPFSALCPLDHGCQLRRHEQGQGQGQEQAYAKAQEQDLSLDKD